MPPRLRRSNHSLEKTPSEMQKAGIELRPTQLEGAGLLCWLEGMYGLGILADDMGVGKTYQPMALIFQNRPSGENEPRTTLLVVPAGAISMWTANLEKFENLKFVEYNNTHKREHFGVEQLAQQDVVLATYNLMAKQYTNYASRKRDIRLFLAGRVSRKVRIERRTWVEEELITQRPWAPLYGMTFQRVILDEDHRIRNIRSGQFKAMSKLQTRSRIACSGTIFNNDYTDVGAILTFLRYQPWCNPSSFRRYFLKIKRKQKGRRYGGKRGLLKHLRGAVFKYTLDGISVRRNKRDIFEGQQIIQVEQLDFQKSSHGLDDTDPYIRYQHRLHTEHEIQEIMKEIWTKQLA